MALSLTALPASLILAVLGTAMEAAIPNESFVPSLLTALDLAGGALVVTDVRAGEPRVVLFNRAALDLFDRTAEEMAGADPILFAAPEMRARLEERKRQLAVGETPPPFEPRNMIDIVRKDGSRVAIEFSVHTFDIEGGRRSVAIALDRSQQLRAVRELAASEARFRSLIESSPDAVAILRGPAFVYLNPSGAQMLGFPTPEAAIGKTMADVLHPEDAPIAAARIREVLVERKSPSVAAEYRFKRPDGYGTAEVRSVPIELDGQAAVLGLARDVGERKALERQLVISERLAAVGQLAASVAHEINNPLAYMLLGLHNLQERLAGEQELPRADLVLQLSEIIDGASRVATIAGDLRAFAHADDGVDLGAVDVTAVIESALRLTAASYRHRARIARRFGEVPKVLANAARLEQVLVNLIVNAVEALSEGQRDDNEIGVAVETVDENHVAIEVRDSGAGIAPEHLERLFDPFFTTKPRGKGTGLGLAISRRLVTGMGGSITARSAPGQGAAFRIVLPRCAALPERPVAEASLRPSARGHRFRVLIIDDEPMLRNALERLLKSKHDVVLEGSGRAALARLERGESYDAILCDVVMPEMSGPELYRQLVEMCPELRPRIVFMTGATTESKEAERLAQTGATILTKPFKLSEIEEAIAVAAASARS